MESSSGQTASREERLDDAIASFLRAKDSQEPPKTEDWLKRYPEFRQELAEFFGDQDRMHKLIVEPTVVSDGDFDSEQTRSQASGPDDGDVNRSTIDQPSQQPRLAAGRYAVKEFLARGGMGEVWIAEDTRIGRKVAFKKLRGKRSEQQDRFLIEAQITGQLEHPGIVPLHDLGIDDEGRPFYVMKFVQGGTLKDAILDFHSADGTQTASKEVEQLKLLDAFLDLCHAVAFAHSRGVLHRDLKPDNVMVGQFGETLLLDWGLAKVMGETEQPNEASYVRISSSGDSTATQDGSIIGSLAYMAPEVAEGRINDVDETTDVYLLGATLYEILTGRLPREGSSQMEMLELARSATPARPRSINPQVAPAMEAICQKAMARRMQDRYQSVVELADDVQNFLAGEPVSAYRETPAERMWRWCRKNRRLLKRSAVAAVFCAAALFAWSVVRENRQLRAVQQATRDVTEFRRLADEVQYFAASADAPSEHAPYYDLQKADASGRKALEFAQKWGAGLNGMPLAQERPGLKQELYELLLLIVQERLQSGADADSVAELKSLLEQAAELRTPTRGHFRLLADCEILAGNDTSAKAASRQLNDPRVTTTANDRFLLGEHLRTVAFSATNPFLDADKQRLNTGRLEQAIDEYRLALEANPRHFWAHMQLGRCYLALGRGPEAIETLGTCVALRPESPWGYLARASARVQLAQYTDAERELSRLLVRIPDFLPARLVLGRARQLQNKLDEAAKEYEVVLAAPAERRLIAAAYYRGEIFLHPAKRDYAKALNEFDLVIAEDPGFYPVYLSRAQLNFARGEIETAMNDLNSFLFLTASGDFDSENWQTYYGRGHFLRLFHAKIPDSVPGRQQKIALLMNAQFQKAVEQGGQSAELFRDLGVSYELMKPPQLEQAIAAYSQGLEFWPNDPTLRVARGWAHLNIGNRNEALADFQQVVQSDIGHAEAHTGLGYMHALFARRNEAEQNATQALLLGRDDYRVLHNVSCIYGVLSTTEARRKQEYLDLAMRVLREAADRSKPHASGKQGELILIQNESFPPELTERPDFRQIVQKLEGN